MKVVSCGAEEAIVVIKTRDLMRLTGRRITDWRSEYSSDLTYTQIGGMEWDLGKILDGVSQLRMMFEARDNIAKTFADLETKTRRMLWPAEPIEQPKAEPIPTKEKKKNG